VALIAALTLSGCAIGPRPTLTLWHSLSGPQEQALLRLIDSYNAANPNGDWIIPERQVPGQLVSTAETVIGTRFGPALMLVSPQQAIALFTANRLTALDARIDSDAGFKPNERADLFPFVLSAGKTADGKTIGIPLGGNARLLLVNKTWLDEVPGRQPPADWAQFDTQCAALLQPGASLTCLITADSGVSLQEWLLSHSARVTRVTGESLLDAPEAVAALTRLNELRLNGAAAGAVSESQLHAEFASGRYAYALDWSGDLRELAALSDATRLAWDVAAIPSNNNIPASIQRAPLLVIPQIGESQAGRSWRFIRWLLEPAQTARWSMETGELPARASAINEIDAARVPAGFLAVLQRVAPRTQAEPLLTTWPCIADTLDVTIRQLIDAPSLTETLGVAHATLVARQSAECPVR
jgi:ABC-type glycerol-3-phosphate transport system substrate-binding protein